MRHHEAHKASIATQRQSCRKTDNKTTHQQLLQTVLPLVSVSIKSVVAFFNIR